MTPGPLPSWPETPFGLDFLSSLWEYKNSTKGQIFFLVCHLGKLNRRTLFVEFLSPNNLGRSASKRWRRMYFLPFSLLSKI